jgi:hypothetical protein
MIKKYVFLNKNNQNVGVFKFNDEIPEQAAMIAAYESGATFLEVPLENKATLGWYFDGEEYVQYPVE